MMRKTADEKADAVKLSHQELGTKHQEQRAREQSEEQIKEQAKGLKSKV
jgi:hypothetical protein